MLRAKRSAYQVLDQLRAEHHRPEAHVVRTMWMLRAAMWMLRAKRSTYQVLDQLRAEHHRPEAHVVRGQLQLRAQAGARHGEQRVLDARDVDRHLLRERLQAVLGLEGHLDVEALHGLEVEVAAGVDGDAHHPQRLRRLLHAERHRDAAPVHHLRNTKISEKTLNKVRFFSHLDGLGRLLADADVAEADMCLRGVGHLDAHLGAAARHLHVHDGHAVHLELEHLLVLLHLAWREPDWDPCLGTEIQVVISSYYGQQDIYDQMPVPRHQASKKKRSKQLHED
eukprot:1196265-Prorocentrum_minimum.AAC.3